MPKKYARPPFLPPEVTQESYLRWLGRKSIAHVRRDKRRGNINAINEAYKMAIHQAVIDSGGKDHYTGELPNWTLLSRYNNDESKEKRRHYRASFALLPTVDHVGDGLGVAEFKICGWRTNDAKNDLTHDKFIALCRRVLPISTAGKAETRAG